MTHTYVIPPPVDADEPVDLNGAYASEDVRPSWEPLDLTDYVNGTVTPIVPTVMARTDGVCLGYPGHVHSLAGESESGKSMLALTVVADELKAGHPVLFIDYESDPGTIVDRLRKMGTTAEQIRHGLDYLNPDTDPYAGPPEERHAWAALLSRPYRLAVIDGVTEAFAVSGVSSIDNDEVTRWGRQVPRTIAARTGAAVFVIDHVTKSTEGRGRYAIGAQAKISYLTGAAYTVEPLAPLGAGMSGKLALRVGKDRPGQVRPHGGTWRKSDRTQAVAVALIDSTNPTRIQYTLEPPARELDPEQEQADREQDLLRRVSEWVRDRPEPSSGKQVRQGVAGNATAIGEALKTLEAQGYITTSPGSHNATLHHHVKPYPSGSGG
ncbi:AAA family ATPase [Citricoccus sp.]|uniref:AAA family ATPase n=1 Tax=Citricoccus sp. TaxID=1978372 RepID=UPI002617A250|nr:AAA family ATPase [Citricoccus sp.]HRO31291.1 AAA family ATPase [Citricoccus sp.]